MFTPTDMKSTPQLVHRSNSYHYSSLPSHAPPVIVQNTTTLRDIPSISSFSHAQRHRDFNALVKKYIYQLLHGCQRPVCYTPTCATARRLLHASKAPAGSSSLSSSKREFTPLSARIIACQLATADEPYRGLCPGLQEPSKDGSGSTGAEVTEGRRRRPDLGMRDSKSFMQGLFSTTAVRSLEMNMLPPPLEVVDIIGGKASSEASSTNNGLLPEIPTDLKVEPKAGEDWLQELDEVFNGRNKMASSNGPRIDPDGRKEYVANGTTKPAAAPPHHSTRPSFQVSTPPTHQTWSHQQSTKSSRRKLSHDLSSYLTSPKNSFFTPDVNELPPLPPPQHLQRQHARDIAQRRSPDTTPSRAPKPAVDEKASTTGTTTPLSTRSTLPLPQAVTHFTVDIISALIGMLDDPAASPYALREAEGFLRQSCHYVFGSAQNLANCFPEDDGSAKKSLLVVQTLKRLFDRGMRKEIVDALWKALGDLFPTVEEVEVDGRRRRLVNPSNVGIEAASRIFLISLQVITAACPIATPEVWERCRRARGKGTISLDVGFEDERILRLVARLARCWHSYGMFESRAKEMIRRYLLNYAKVEKQERVEKLQRELGRELAGEVVDSGVGKGGWGIVVCSMEWMRAVLLSEWDGGERPRSGGVVDSSIRFLRFLYDDHEALGLEESYFHNQVLADRLEYKDMPVKWYLKKPKPTTDLTLLDAPPSDDVPLPSGRPDSPHILNHAFLLPPSALVKFFRSINFHRMSAAYDEALAMYRFVNQMAIVTRPNFKPWLRHFIMKSYDIAMNMYLLLEVHRTSVVQDTLDQLVGRELRECLRPLKVRFLDVGEEGVDHGGVQQEYFRLLWEEVTRGEYGCFTTDDRTRFNWFSIVTLEPMHKFELLGLLVGLAVYNGVTLPVSFPLVMYRKLLGWKVGLEDLADGWPELVKGMRGLLEWKEEDGDVGDIFVRSYEFGYEAFGGVHSVDLMKVGREDRWAPVSVEKKPVKDPESNWLPGSVARKYRTMPALPRPQLTIPQLHRAVSDPDEFSNTIADENQSNTLEITDSISTSDTSSRRMLTPEILTPGSPASPSSSASRRNSAVVIDENDEAAATWKAYHKQQQSLSAAQSNCSSTSPVKLTSENFTKPETDESELVTNENREQYVGDYVFWLTDKSIRPQFEAFDRGFHSVLDRKSLSLFNPTTLRHLVEGSKEIDIAALEAAAKYDDGYHPNHRCIKDFWAIARTYDNDQKRALLEFVTASDRVPVSGISSVMFVIQRNGGDSERVPTSLTCFGRLLLPEYSGRKKMREKLRVALENGRGFGVP
ncbi:hypothetical protein H072_2266 [Dactylellina haptotyla CBS 200.50]|uniref:HECT-type E3 ubiquitin transferase n=1 Tax=Dactylellina haptotyla (strain CBS 200.50) TaxID=1284197 RepID=S8ALG8_DACHA|nr:hypothetical protein H072_2266 [Dactylellina haptotyla CBS 200.50]